MRTIVFAALLIAQVSFAGDASTIPVPVTPGYAAHTTGRPLGFAIGLGLDPEVGYGLVHHIGNDTVDASKPFLGDRSLPLSLDGRLGFAPNLDIIGRLSKDNQIGLQAQISGSSIIEKPNDVPSIVVTALYGRGVASEEVAAVKSVTQTSTASKAVGQVFCGIFTLGLGNCSEIGTNTDYWHATMRTERRHVVAGLQMAVLRGAWEPFIGITSTYLWFETVQKPFFTNEVRFRSHVIQESANAGFTIWSHKDDESKRKRNGLRLEGLLTRMHSPELPSVVTASIGASWMLYF